MQFQILDLRSSQVTSEAGGLPYKNIRAFASEFVLILISRKATEKVVFTAFDYKSTA